MANAQTSLDSRASSVPGPREWAIAAIGLAALLYLSLAWRASYLDLQVSLADEQLQQYKVELWKLNRDLDERLAPEAGGRTEDAPAGLSPCPPVDLIPCKTLPTVQNSAIVELAGHREDARVEGPKQRKVARNPDDR